MHITNRAPGESGRDYALRTLRDNIIRLTLEPGSKVSENDLSAELGLSRGPIREALIELKKVRIVEVYPQRGSFIALIDLRLIEEARFMRETLESAAAQRCCKLGVSRDWRDSLCENMQLQQFYLDNENYDKLMETDDIFHSLLFSAAGVTRVHNLMKSMMIHFDRVRVMAMGAAMEGLFVEDHADILEAVLAGDSEAVKLLMHRHFIHCRVDEAAMRAKYSKYLKPPEPQS